MQSHCIGFSDISYMRRVLGVGNVKRIQVPIYGHTATIHDSITRNKGSFVAAMRALSNFKKLEFNNVQLHTLFLGQSEEKLNQLFKFLFKFGYQVDASLPSIATFKGQYSEEFLKKIPGINFNGLEPFFRKIKKHKKIDKLFLYDIPFCLAPGISNINFKSESFYGGYDHFKGRRIDTIETKRGTLAAYRVLVKKKECRGCIFNSFCGGIAKVYIDLKLFKLTPQKNKIS